MIIYIHLLNFDSNFDWTNCSYQDAPMNHLQLFWGSHISIVSMSPNFLLLLVNVLLGHKLPIRYHRDLMFKEKSGHIAVCI